MGDIYPPVVQRPRLLEFAAAVNSRANALRRDECGDWAIHGRNDSKVFAVPIKISRPSQTADKRLSAVLGMDHREGFQLVVFGWTAKGWNAAKRDLAFARLVQDGDADGSLILDRLPTEGEAPVIRHWLAIPKKRQVSDEELARLAAVGFLSRGKPTVGST